MQDITNILLLASFGGILGLVGGLVFLNVRPWTKWLSKYSIPFAAGVLLTVSLVGILPEVAEVLEEQGFRIFLFAFLGSYLFENLFTAIHHHGDVKGHTHRVVKSIPLVIVGDTLHNFIDGVAIAAAYLVHPGLGVVTAIATFLHEVPHEIGDFGLLLKAGWAKPKIFLVNFTSALATLVGAIFVVTTSTGEESVMPLLAISGGMFLYLGATDFLPEVKSESENPVKAIMALLAGCLIMLLVFELVPH